MHTGTLVNALLHHVDDLSGIGGEKRPIVHRLDKGTSGLMVVAKHDRAHEELARQFADREVEKEYFALWGEVMAGRRIDAPIGRDPSNRKKMSSEPLRVRRTREAVTRIVRAEHFGRMLTMAQVAIHTGRTHQIRVHLSAIGHPIVGDSLYGGVRRRIPGDLRAVSHLDRPFLHAAHLVFKHPDDQRKMDFTSALPEDLQNVLDELRAQFDPAMHGDPWPDLAALATLGGRGSRGGGPAAVQRPSSTRGESFQWKPSSGFEMPPARVATSASAVGRADPVQDDGRWC